MFARANGRKWSSTRIAIPSALMMAFGCGDSKESDVGDSGGGGKGGTGAGATGGSGGTTAGGGGSAGSGGTTAGSGGSPTDAAAGSAGSAGAGGTTGAGASGGTAGRPDGGGVPCGSATCGANQYCGVDYGPSCRQEGSSCKNLPERCNGIAACPCVCLQCSSFQGVINCGCG